MRYRITCENCKESFSLNSEYIINIDHLKCPKCNSTFPALEFLQESSFYFNKCAQKLQGKFSIAPEMN